jgi:transcriptional regulator with XRE-family HTH domain
MSEVVHIKPGGRDRRPRPLLRTLVGEVLRRHRLEQRRTLADVARAARVSMPYLSEVERGRKEASSEVLAAVCDALRIELADVLAEIGRDLTRDRAPVLRLATVRRAGIASPATPARPAPIRRGDVMLLAA